jgi:hypothetical protein
LADPRRFDESSIQLLARKNSKDSMVVPPSLPLLLLLLLMMMMTLHSCRRLFEKCRSSLLRALLRAWYAVAASARERRLKGLLKLAEDNASHVSQTLMIALAVMQWRAHARDARAKRANVITYLRQQQLALAASSSPSSPPPPSSLSSGATASVEVYQSSHLMALRQFSVSQSLAKGCRRKVR